MAEKEMVCIVCPIGCRITVIEDTTSENGYSVIGHTCKRGIDYGIKEMTNPTRVITSTVKIKNAHLKRLPVKTDGAIPKDLNFKCMEVINSIEVTAPIKMGEIIVQNVLGTGVNLIASRSM